MQSIQTRWVDFLSVQDPDAAIRLAAQTGDRAALAFQTMRFGTGGLRSLLGEGPGLMNRYTVAHATRALAAYAAGQDAPHSVAIAYDTRHGSREFAAVAAAVLLDAGFEVHLADGPLPTPLLSYAVRHLKLGWGIVLTASHNPPAYNGYKVYDGRGVQALPGITKRIAEVMEGLDPCQPCPALDASHPRLHWMGGTLREDYLSELRQTLPAPARPVKILYTALHGSGAAMVPQALEGHDLTCIQCTPDPDFGGLPAPNPEVPEVFAEALAKAATLEPELILATDADSDRVGVLVRTCEGYKPLNGNQIGALLADLCVPDPAPEGAVLVTTLVSGSLAQRIVKARGAQISLTLTGFKYIGDKAEALKAQGKRMLFGYEESYGYLTGDLARDKDAVQACALLAALASKENLYERWISLSDRYGHDAELLLTVDLPPADYRQKMATVMDAFRSGAGSMLESQGAFRVIDYSGGVDGLPPENVLALEGENGRVLLRPSGTEPKIKCYVMARGDDADAAQARCQALAGIVRGRLQSLIAP